jgi:hypothetical protein
LLANYSVHYTSAANCGLVMRERPDSPGNAETKGTRKEKLPVNTENLPPGCDEGDAIDIELPNGKDHTDFSEIVQINYFVVKVKMGHPSNTSVTIIIRYLGVLLI